MVQVTFHIPGEFYHEEIGWREAIKNTKYKHNDANK
jgi:hypothetical protein